MAARNLHLVFGLVVATNGRRAGLGAVVKGKKSLLFPYRELKPGRLSHRLVTILTELPRFLCDESVLLKYP
jgi:hypothetical protein